MKTECLSTLSLRIDDYLTNSSHNEATSIFLYPMKDKIHVKNCRSQKVENLNSLLVQISSENGAPEPDRKHGKPKSLLQWCVPTWHGKGEKTLVEKMVENKNSGNRNMHHKGIGSHTYTWLRTGKSVASAGHQMHITLQYLALFDYNFNSGPAAVVDRCSSSYLW